MRSVPLRLLPALLTTLLLYLSGDMVGWWALSWVVFIPLCVACRGAGAPAALLLGTAAFLPAAVVQSLWLLDVEGASPALVWLAAGVLPALALFAIELPVCRSIPGLLRPVLLAALAVGCWHLLPGEARMLVPVGGLIDSEIVRFVYPMVGLPLMAGLMLGLAWLCAELIYNPRARGRRGLPGIALACALVVFAVADHVGSGANRMFTGTQYVTPLQVVPADADWPAESLLPPDDTGLVVLSRTGDHERALKRAGDFAERHRANLVLMMHTPGARHAYFFHRARRPAVSHTWFTERGEPLVIEGTRKPVIDSVGILRVFPSLESNEHWAARIDLELYLSDAKPAHPAQLAFWLREMRREALVRGSRQVCTWRGGAAIIDGAGRVVALTADKPLAVKLPAQDLSGQPLGRARLTVLERIFAMAAPVLLLMLVLLTPVRWAKLRYRERRQADTTFAIEEVIDDETTLSREQTETITRRFEKTDQS